MLEWLQVMLSTDGFMPHGHCYLWKPGLLWMHVLSDSAIFLSYAAIPVALAIFASKRKDMPFSWVFVLFGVFIVACGFTHLLAVVTVWQPTYWLTGVVKVITAIASVFTALVLFPLLPKALAIPSPAMLQAANDELTIQINERMRVESQIKEKNSQLQAVNSALTDSLNKLKHTQDQLIAQEKMASLGGLVTGVAHEINTPIGIAVTAASHLNDKTCEIIQMSQENKLEKTHFEDYLDIMKSSSNLVMNSLQRAATLIKSFKKIAVDQSSEEKQNILIKQHLEDVLLNLMPTLMQSGHSISINCHEQLSFECYAGAFTQIFSNLITNSLLHGFEHMQAGIITIDIEAPDAHGLLINYHDNGQGIPLEDQNKIFDPFFTTKRSQGGPGLGLHIIHNIVCQKMKGEISVESNHEQGTTFLIRLPNG